MMKYTLLGEIINFKRGYDLPSSVRKDGAVPVISSSGITDFHSEHKKVGEGVVTGRYGTLGEIFYINGRYWPLNTTLYITDFKGNYPKFIYYFLKTLHLENFNGAAAVPGLDRNVLHKIKVPIIENSKTQKKIASILCAYDDLIENNNQRIKLLEEIAEEIYKEWFVRFRFPGYEKTKFINKEGVLVPHDTKGAVPESWEICRIGDLLSEIGRGPSLNYEIPDGEGKPVLNQSCVRNGLIELQKVLYAEDVPKSKVNLYLKKNDVLINSMGDGTLGRVSKNVQYESNEFIIHNCITYLRASSEYSQYVLYYLIKQYKPYYISIAQGSTGQSTLKKELVAQIKTLKPERNTLRDFDRITSPIWKEIGILKNKNQVLQQTRDLLLPRLISGKLSVEDLEINESLNMAAEPQSNY